MAKKTSTKIRLVPEAKPDSPFFYYVKKPTTGEKAKIKLKKARKKIDQLDKKIFNLIKKRTQVVRYMLSLKKFKYQIVDHKRINEILRIIKNKSIKNRIDPKTTRRIWKSMIWSYVDFQKRNFKKK